MLPRATPVLFLRAMRACHDIPSMRAPFDGARLMRVMLSIPPDYRADTVMLMSMIPPDRYFSRA